jgi:phosphoribosylformylglycinamidine (FGAM) synthase-like enzyme
VGAEVELASAERRDDLTLFGEGPSRVVVSVRAESARHFEQLMGEFRLPWRWIGRVAGDRLSIRVGSAVLVDAAVDQVADAWRGGFERYVS